MNQLLQGTKSHHLLLGVSEIGTTALSKIVLSPKSTKTEPGRKFRMLVILNELRRKGTKLPFLIAEGPLLAELHHGALVRPEPQVFPSAELLFAVLAGCVSCYQG